jgi:hypothetical protein
MVQVPASACTRPGAGWIAGNLIANNISGCGGGIYDSFSAGLTIEDNETIANVARKRAGGVLIEMAADILRDNHSTGNHADMDGGGLVLWDSDAMVDSNRFLHNTAFTGAGVSLGNGCLAKLVNNWIIQSSGDGIWSASSSPRIVNNTIVGPATPGDATGIELDSPVSGSPPDAMINLVVNNIVCGFDHGVVGRSAVTPTLDYNDVWHSRLGECDLPAHVVSGTHSIALDPRLVGPAEGDAHLGADSPCVDAGDPDGVPPAPPLDIDGDARPYGGRVDIGADEFVGLWSIGLARVVR